MVHCIATFMDLREPDWKFVVKLYISEYEDEARFQAEKDWKDNFSGWRMNFKRIPYLDSYRSAVVCEFSK